MLNENSLHSSTKCVDTLACEGSRLGQVGMDMGGKVVARGKTHSVASTLAHFPNNYSKIANGVLDCLLQLTQMSTSILDARKGNEEAKDVVGALKDPENPQVPHHLFQAQSLHEAISTKNL